MSDTYNYADGAVHHDHHRSITINGTTGRDLQALLKAFMADEAEEVDVVSCEVEPIEKRASKRRSAGRTSEELFEEGRQEQVMLFTDFLKEHHRFSTEIDTSKGNYVNKAFIAFYAQWMKSRLVSAQPNGNACYRFLKDDCGLSMKSEKKTYANFIRAYITDVDAALDDVALAVEDFLLKKKGI